MNVRWQRECSYWLKKKERTCLIYHDLLQFIKYSACFKCPQYIKKRRKCNSGRMRHFPYFGYDSCNGYKRKPPNYYEMFDVLDAWVVLLKKYLSKEKLLIYYNKIMARRIEIFYNSGLHYFNSKVICNMFTWFKNKKQYDQLKQYLILKVKKLL